MQQHGMGGGGFRAGGVGRWGVQGGIPWSGEVEGVG